MSYLKKYEYVIAVERFGGITQAAEHLGISQPTFSKYLKKLEQELGVELVDRSTLPIKLTRAGECFVEAGKRFLDLDRQLNKQLTDVKLGGGSVVRVGISPSRTAYTMPEVVAHFKGVCPDVQVVIEERTTAELNARLSEGELDLVISLLDDGTRGFERRELFDEGVVLAVPRTMAAGCESVVDALRAAPLISVGRGQVMWQLLGEMVDRLSLDGAKIECQSIESAMSLVRAGLGATVVPSYMAGKEEQNVKFFDLEGVLTGGFKRTVCLFYRKEQFLSKAELAFIDSVLAVLKK